MLADNFTNREVNVGHAVKAHHGADIDTAVHHLFLVDFDGDLAGCTTENINASNTGNRSEERFDFVFDFLAEFCRV